MKHTLVICDKDKQYAYKIAGYINNKPGFPFEVRVPDSLDEIVNKKTSMNIDLFLVDMRMWRKNLEHMSREQIRYIFPETVLKEKVLRT